MNQAQLPIYGKRNRSYAKAVHFDDFNPKDYVIVDIRHLNDYETRHLPDAIHIAEYDKLIEVFKNHPDQKILLQCYSGHTVSQLGNDLVLQGYQNVYFLDEVLEDFWEQN